MTSARLSLVVIRCADLAASRAFYEALGMAFELERHGKGPEHLSCDRGGVVFELYPARPEPAVPGERLGFDVDDLQSTIRAVKETGASVRSGPSEGPWGLRAVVVDPDGRSVELVGRLGV